VTFDQVFELGYLDRIHGIKGELLLLLDVDNPDHYLKLGSVFLNVKGKLIPFFVQGIKKQRNDQFLIKFEDIQSDEEAQDLVGCSAYLPIELLPPLRDDQYYFHELVGMQVHDQILGPVGNVTMVLETPQQYLLQFEHEGCEVLCPMHDDLIDKVDKAARVIHLQLPAGLLDVYKNQ
jgi:16S rRNA processing protein RimM